MLFLCQVHERSIGYYWGDFTVSHVWAINSRDITQSQSMLLAYVWIYASNFNFKAWCIEFIEHSFFVLDIYLGCVYLFFSSETFPVRLNWQSCRMNKLFMWSWVAQSAYCLNGRVSDGEQTNHNFPELYYSLLHYVLDLKILWFLIFK